MFLEKKCMSGCCQTTVVKNPARPLTLPWKRVPSYFSHVLLSKQITTTATEGKEHKVEILPSSFFHINLT